MQAEGVKPEEKTVPLTPGAGLSPAVRRFRGRVRSLASEHQNKIASNLGYLAIAFATFTLFGILALNGPGVWAFFTLGEFLLTLVSGAAFVLVSVGMFLLTRSRLSAQRKLDIGLVYQVLGAFGWSITDVYRLNSEIDIERVSWVVLWVTLFPIVAPSKFGRTFVANVLTACTIYLAYLLLSAVGIVTADHSFGTVGNVPVLFIALVAMIPVYFQGKVHKDLEQAERMGSYELTVKLGEGAMGEVWKARHNLLAHECAIKLIKAESLLRNSDGSNAELAVRRFEREARATAALRSPNTVNLYDFGVTDSGTCYYVMEFLDGMDLDTLVMRFGPVEPTRAVYLLRQICRSLIEAHGAGLVHRDIKPANIFVCRLNPDCDVIKVLDFGLVKRSVFSSDETRLTTEGMVAGTPAFLAPEQAKGEKDVDGRADLYAVGCVAYWLLTGRQVFEGETPMKVILAHVGEKPIPPSERTELDIPSALQDVILTCLEKDAGRRPQSARELEGLLAGIRLDDLWSLEKAEKWWATHMPPAE